jgi:Helix-turn-helix domain
MGHRRDRSHPVVNVGGLNRSTHHPLDRMMSGGVRGLHNGAGGRVVDQVAKRGESSRLIGRALRCHPSSVRAFLARSGGVRPTPRRRSVRHLTATEREEVSRGIAAGLSARAIAALIGRSASTVSREIARSGGRDAYRAQTVPARVEPGAACRCAGPTGGRLVSRADRRVASPRTSHRSHAAPSLRPLGEAPAQGAGLARSWPVAEHGLDPGSSCRRDRAVRGRALGRRPGDG